MDKVRCRCSGCGSRFQVSAPAAEKGARCPKCAGALEVAPAEAPDVDLLPPPPPRKPVPIVDRVSGRVLSAEPPGAAPARKFALCLDMVFVYPFSGLGGAIFLGFMVPFWAVLRTGIIPFGGLLQLIVGGYIAAYMFNVLYETSMGKDRAPGPPGGTDFGELLGYFVRFFGATLVAFAPAIAVGIGLVYSMASGDGGWAGANPLLLALLGIAVLFGTLYYPMALMIIGFAESWWAGFNYVFGVRSILRILGDYLLCAVFFVVTAAAAGLLEFLWVAASAEASLGGRAMAYGVATAAELYLWVVQMRVLGLLYMANKERLGWFR